MGASVLLFNCDGVPPDPEDPKARAIFAAVRGATRPSGAGGAGGAAGQALVVVLCETRSNQLCERLAADLPDYRIFSTRVAREGRKGHGVAILVHHSISDAASEWRSSRGAQALWVRIEGQALGLAGDLLVCGAYINPISGGNGGGDALGDRFEAWGSDLAGAAASFSHIIAMGDFNASLATASEFADGPAQLLAAFPELEHSRRSTALTSQGRVRRVNEAGRQLQERCRDAGLILTTGRHSASTPCGDTGQPTCRGATRTEHIALSPSLYGLPFRVQALSDFGFELSDHCPVRLSFPAGLAGAAAPQAPAPAAEPPQEQDGLQLFWRLVAGLF